MFNLKLKELKLGLAKRLAARFPDLQFLPQELHDVVLAVINSVGMTALEIAVTNTQREIATGSQPEDLSSTEVLETVERFATEQFPRESIVELIADMSGFDEQTAEAALGVFEEEIDEIILGLHGAATDVRIAGLGTISAGADHTYLIVLDENLVVPPLKNISVLSLFERSAVAE